MKFNLFAKLVPFLFLGIMLVILLAGFILLSYLLIWGAIIGLILFSLAWIRDKLFPSKQLSTPVKSKAGRVFEHEERL